MLVAGKELSEETVKKACEAYGIKFDEIFDETVSKTRVLAYPGDEYIYIRTFGDYTGKGKMTGPCDMLRTYIGEVDELIELLRRAEKVSKRE